MPKHIRLSATALLCAGASGCADEEQWERLVRKYIDTELEKVSAQKPDLFLFPEMCGFSSGMDMELYLEYARRCGRRLIAYAAGKAAELGIWIAFSTVRLTDRGGLRNSCILIDRQGQTAGTYDKVYLTQGELDAGMEPGEGPVVIDCELGRIGFAICFDLNYPQLAREYRSLGTELILFPSLFHGGLLKQLWAFSAGCWLIGACGGCEASVVDPAGWVQVTSAIYFPWLTADIDLDYLLVHLDFNVEKLEKLRKQYGTQVKIDDPGGLGAVLVFSLIPGMTTRDLARELEITPRSDYLEDLKVKNEAVRTGELRPRTICSRTEDNKV